MKKIKKPSILQALRDIRENMSVKYWQQPEKLMEDLKAVREQHMGAAKAQKTK
jgi:hypothetical protein